MLIISFICTFLLLNKLIEKVQKNPIVVYRPDVATETTQVPFPAVTFCPALKPADKIYNFSDVLNHFNKINNLNQDLNDDE